MENIEQIDTTDYFAHLSNDDLVTYFSQLLGSRMELIQFTYPGELLEEDAAMIEHLKRCEAILYDRLQGMLNMTLGRDGRLLSKEVKQLKFKEKSIALSKLFMPMVEQYFQDVSVRYIAIDSELIEIDFSGQDYSNDKGEQ
ncbi:hypothetical protein [Flavobacterium sp. FlaQc-48]|uniref:hypothetical protein n=1 Tax=Flavobacterium sp. FlaQc-48 TaxID=3374181 RepID=UPI003756BAE2